MLSTIARTPLLIAAGTGLVVAALTTGCGEPAPEPDHRATAQSITRKVDHDAVSLTVALAPREIVVNETARFTVELLAESGVTVQVEDYAPALLEGDRRFELDVRLAEETTAAPTEDGRLRWTHAYDVTFYLPGEYEFPPATASYVDLRGVSGADRGVEAVAAETRTIQSESLTVTVSDVRQQPLTDEELADIEVPDPVDLRRPWSARVWLITVAAVMLCALAAYLVRRRRRADHVIPTVPAHVWARLQLDELIADALVERGQMQDFYYRISGIVRGYIERRFHVSAPEMTTEEFLAAAGEDGRFDPAQTESLNEFLTQCDLVKYARHAPASHEAQEAIRSAEAFVKRTRERDDSTTGATRISGGAA